MCLIFTKYVDVFQLSRMRRAPNPQIRPSLTCRLRERVRSFTAGGVSPGAIASLGAAAAGKIPDHHHGVRHSICCAEGVEGASWWGLSIL